MKEFWETNMVDQDWSAVTAFFTLWFSKVTGLFAFPVRLNLNASSSVAAPLT